VQPSVPQAKTSNICLEGLQNPLKPVKNKFVKILAFATTSSPFEGTMHVPQAGRHVPGIIFDCFLKQETFKSLISSSEEGRRRFQRKKSRSLIATCLFG
jgi:hypothetical protein